MLEYLISGMRALCLAAHLGAKRHHLIRSGHAVQIRLLSTDEWGLVANARRDVGDGLQGLPNRAGAFVDLSKM